MAYSAHSLIYSIAKTTQMARTLRHRPLVEYANTVSPYGVQSAVAFAFKNDTVANVLISVISTVSETHFEVWNIDKPSEMSKAETISQVAQAVISFAHEPVRLLPSLVRDYMQEVSEHTMLKVSQPLPFNILIAVRKSLSTLFPKNRHENFSIGITRSFNSEHYKLFFKYAQYSEGQYTQLESRLVTVKIDTTASGKISIQTKNTLSQKEDNIKIVDDLADVVPALSEVIKYIKTSLTVTNLAKAFQPTRFNLAKNKPVTVSERGVTDLLNQVINKEFMPDVASNLLEHLTLVNRDKNVFKLEYNGELFALFELIATPEKVTFHDLITGRENEDVISGLMVAIMQANTAGVKTLLTIKVSELLKQYNVMTGGSRALTNDEVLMLGSLIQCHKTELNIAFVQFFKGSNVYQLNDVIRFVIVTTAGEELKIGVSWYTGSKRPLEIQINDNKPSRIGTVDGLVSTLTEQFEHAHEKQAQQLAEIEVRNKRGNTIVINRLVPSNDKTNTVTLAGHDIQRALDDLTLTLNDLLLYTTDTIIDNILDLPWYNKNVK